jgi:pre-mRNA-splicing helicase BRR2
VDTSAFKIVYVAPMKALVAEMVGNFGKRLEKFGIQARTRACWPASSVHAPV